MAEINYALDVRTGHLINVAMMRRLEGPFPVLEELAAKYSAVPERHEAIAALKLRVGTSRECIETAISISVPPMNVLAGWAIYECKRLFPDFYNQLRRNTSIWQKTK